jgi:hypothetical protein
VSLICLVNEAIQVECEAYSTLYESKLKRRLSPGPDPLLLQCILTRVVDPDPDSDPDWIRIQWGVWIRIRNPDPDPDPGARKRRK